MTTCRQCGHTRPCGCHHQHVHGSHHHHPTTPDPYAHSHTTATGHYHHSHVTPHPTEHGYGVIPTSLPPSESCDYGPAQPIERGMFQALDACGKPVPYARVTVTYVATNQLVPLFYRPIASPDYAQSNPVVTNEKGRAPIYFFSQGHDIRVVVECVDANGNAEIIDSYVVYASTLEKNFDLSNLDDKQCLSLDNPRVLIYDKDDCNKPYSFMDLRYAMIAANIAAGIPAGSWTDVKNYYQCLGCEEWEDGVVVWGECGCGILYQYKGSCDQECPPDPCDVTFDDEGESTCWRICNHKVDCCPETAITTGATGGGVCVNLTSTGSGDTDFIYQSRDNTVAEGTAAIGDIGTVGPLTVTVNNTYDTPIVVAIHWDAIADSRHPNSGDESIVWVFSTTLAESVPSWEAVSGNTARDKRHIVASPAGENLEVVTFANETRAYGGSATTHHLVAVGGTLTMYGQWYYIQRDGPVSTLQLIHGYMFANVNVHENGVTI